MMRNRKWIACLLMLTMLLPAFALAEEEFDGTVVAGDTETVLAPYGGTVGSVSLRAGDLIHESDTVVSMETTKVLAPEDGTVRGVFAEVGDTLSDTTVLNIAPVNKYTVTCSLKYAYPTVDMYYVHIGETVYLKCKPDGTHKARGVITAVNGSSYTVETTAGELYLEETVYVYRSSDYSYTERIGSGTVGRTAEQAITATGSLLKLHVSSGDTVERGQLLFETVSGSLDALAVTGSDVKSGVDGVIADVKVQAGDQVSKGDVLLTVYDPATYQIAFSVDEDLLGSVKVGDSVNIVFNWDEDSGVTFPGTVTSISYLSESESATATDTSSSSSTTYKGYATFQPDDSVRLGMSVEVTTIDE